MLFNAKINEVQSQVFVNSLVIDALLLRVKELRAQNLAMENYLQQLGSAENAAESAIKKKIDEILEKKLNLPDTVPSQVTDLEGKVESIILDKLPSIIPEYLPSDLLARIENMERLLRLQREASIASPIPTDDQNAIKDSEKKIIPLPDTLIASPIPTDDQNAIEDLTDQSSLPAKKKGLTDSELARHLGIDKSNITRWKQKGEPTQKYRDKWEFRGRFWYEKD